MIVRPHPQGWQIILHPAHGLLAGRLYQQLRDTPTGQLALPTLLAVAEHDDRQLDFSSADYLTELGAPKDFTLLATTDKQRSLQAETLLQDSYRKHAWAYLLVGKHYEFLYAGQQVDKRLQRLLDDVRKQRKQLLATREWPADLLDLTYGQLRFCDRLSLLLCGSDVPTLGRSVEINDGLAETTYLRQNPETETYTVHPWPFVQESFDVSAEFFLLPQLSFSSSKALGKMIGETPARQVSWTFTAAPPSNPAAP